MAISFPSGLDTLVNPTSGDSFDTAGVLHDVQHSDLNDAIEALQAKAGVDGSMVETSLDRIVTSLFEVWVLCVGEEATAATVGTGKLTFNLTFRCRITGVSASVSTAPTGAALKADLKWGSESLLSPVITIDAGTTTTAAASAPPAIGSGWENDWFDGDRLTVEVTQIGSSTAGAGLKIYLETRRDPDGEG